MMKLFSNKTTTLAVSSILCSFVAILSNTTIIMLLSSVTDSVYGFNTNHISLVYDNRPSVFQPLLAATNALSSRRNNKCHSGIDVIVNNNRDCITSLSMLSPTDVEGEVITDTAIALCDYATFLPDIKTSNLRIKYAEVIGRILFIDVSLLPGNTFHPEELAIKMFLLGASMQPIIRSIRLFRCRRDATVRAMANCNDEECILDYDDLGNIYESDCELECTYIDITIDNENGNKNKNDDHDHDMDTFK